ncbi:hypothetical protein FRC08_014415 [Ceratobasidium sp. 394]|nr:hypothetical protein FRC08_014415 [Ceratobasidium sp. 394]
MAAIQVPKEIARLYDNLPFRRENIVLDPEPPHRTPGRTSVIVRALDDFMFLKDGKFTYPTYDKTADWWEGVAAYGWMLSPTGDFKYMAWAGQWESDYPGKHMELVVLKNLKGISKEGDKHWRKGMEEVLWLETGERSAYALLRPALAYNVGGMWEGSVITSWTNLPAGLSQRDPSFRATELESKRPAWWYGTDSDKAWNYFQRPIKEEERRDKAAKNKRAAAKRAAEKRERAAQKRERVAEERKRAAKQKMSETTTGGKPGLAGRGKEGTKAGDLAAVSTGEPGPSTIGKRKRESVAETSKGRQPAKKKSKKAIESEDGSSEEEDPSFKYEPSSEEDSSSDNEMSAEEESQAEEEASTQPNADADTPKPGQPAVEYIVIDGDSPLRPDPPRASTSLIPLPPMTLSASPPHQDSVGPVSTAQTTESQICETGQPSVVDSSAIPQVATVSPGPPPSGGKNSDTIDSGTAANGSALDADTSSMGELASRTETVGPPPPADNPTSASDSSTDSQLTVALPGPSSTGQNDAGTVDASAPPSVSTPVEQGIPKVSSPDAADIPGPPEATGRPATDPSPLDEAPAAPATPALVAPAPASLAADVASIVAASRARDMPPSITEVRPLSVAPTDVSLAASAEALELDDRCSQLAGAADICRQTT